MTCQSQFAVIFQWMNLSHKYKYQFKLYTNDNIFLQFYSKSVVKNVQKSRILRLCSSDAQKRQYSASHAFHTASKNRFRSSYFRIISRKTWDLEAVSRENANVSGNPITELDFYDVAHYQLLSVHVQLLTRANYYCELQQKSLFIAMLVLFYTALAFLRCTMLTGRS